LAHLPKLRYISVLATGTNVVDLAAARARNIPVSNVPAYSTASVAQMVFALLLEMTQQVGHHAARVTEGAWCRSTDFSFCERPLVELEGMTLGIVGFGAIGRRVAQIARAFGMKLLVQTAHPEKYRSTPDAANVEFVDLDTLFARSDVVSLHCPLTETTQNIVDCQLLATMKRRAFLINTGRGPLLDEMAVATALKDGILAGVGVDVLSCEPPKSDNPLLAAPNIFITPHIAWATRAARERLLAVSVANVARFINGTLQNVVN